MDRIMPGRKAVLLLALVAAALSGCAVPGTQGDYWNIAPVYQVRNSPVPVPVPRARPDRRPHLPAGRAPGAAHADPGVRASAEAATAAVLVRRGDTVYGLARRYNVPLEAMIAVNGLESPYRLAVGQSLSLPAQRRHEVRKGETLYAIARRHDIEPETLARANNIAPPYRLAVGQSLAIPNSADTELKVAARSSPRLPVPRAGDGFSWPLSGAIVSHFGPKEGGLRNDGINIAAPRGALVRAADHGVVAYAGDGLKGFGKLILIRHEGDYVTAYAHNERLLVARGDVVRKGEAIAHVGSTGGVRDPQLHFEVRRGVKPLDPLTVLPHLTASAEP
ncbi:MAG: LysM peptidoglycan-binding domain-containing M23 family metallopeptidase [Rhodothalassiaceae bacterium]